MPEPLLGHRSLGEGGPRLLYVADVPAESTQHGSALIYRLFDAYPAERLCIVETGLPSDPSRRLPAVRYVAAPIGQRRWLNTRLGGAYSAWLTYRSGAAATGILDAVAGFKAEAVATVGHGFGWSASAVIAQRLGVPLHLIVHDDWPRLASIPAVLRPWLDRRFGRVYRGAATRLCVSPFMMEAYQQRYGIDGSVMYPSRSADCQVFEPLPARPIGTDSPLTVGYGGNSGHEMMSCLETLAGALDRARARLVVFGPFGDDARRRLLALSSSIAFTGFVPYHEMIAGLRAAADVLFVPMTFAAADRDNQIVSFPSKLTDYTATGLPLLIYGPAYSSAVRWARTAEDVAEVVDQPGVEALAAALARLRDDAARRSRLAVNATVTGQQCFDAERARAVLASALQSARA